MELELVALANGRQASRFRQFMVIKCVRMAPIAIWMAIKVQRKRWTSWRCLPEKPRIDEPSLPKAGGE